MATPWVMKATSGLSKGLQRGSALNFMSAQWRRRWGAQVSADGVPKTAVTDDHRMTTRVALQLPG